ncbi:acyl-CoA-like ligand-binding transcription factor [Nonomuraea sediminis]|uniref:acyl-CoA-like ligand-binding transcription factor n=1 Tax=Nonomuraea sediminis TaxID=2835864 RepID=UPI001BDBC6E8|nr:TetR family transcriptional regulator [Nonomuraea sediminis]
MNDERAGLRERKKQETRIALSWAAIRLAAERGLDNVRVEDIAAEAGVSPRTFNNYFSSKGAAIAARHLERIRQIADELRARPASEPLWDAITNAVLARFGLSQEGHMDGLDVQQWVSALRLMLTEPSVQGEIHRANAAGVAELAVVIAERTGTDVTRDLYPRLVAGCVGAALGVVTDQWLHAEASVSIPTLLRDALGQVAAGLPVP